MALIKLGGVVTQISGKVGGQTFGTGPAGSYMKNSGTPRKSITTLQLAKMSTAALTAQSWRALTQTVRNTYIAASPSYPYLNRVGETKFYSGYQIYCKLKGNQEASSVLVTNAPLPIFSFTLPATTTLVYAVGVLTLDSSSAQLGVVYRLFMSSPASIGISNSYRNQYFIVQVTSSDLTTGKNVTVNFTDKFGAFTTGTKCYWSLNAVATASGQTLKKIVVGSITF